MPPFTGGNTITWTSQTILKDNEKAFDYMGSEVVNILSGQSVHMWQPRSVLHLIGANMVEKPTHLVLKPAEPSYGCIFDGSEEFEEFYVVEELPFDYAILVLTGWDLQYECENHEIERIGIFLANFEYVKDPIASTGALNYTIFSTLRDDSDNGHDAKYKVSIPGLNELGGGSEK